MAESQGTLENIAGALAKMIHPLEERLVEGQILILLAELDLDLPAAVESNGAVKSALDKMVKSAGLLLPMLIELIEKIDDEDYGAALAQGIELGLEIKTFIEGATGLATAIKGAPHPGVSNADIEALPRRLFDYLIVRHAEGIPAVAEILEFAALFAREPKLVGGQEVLVRSIDLGRIGDLMSSPAAILESEYGWGTNGFDGGAMLDKLQKLLNAKGIPAIVDASVDPPVLDLLFAEIQADISKSPPGLTLAFNDAIGFGADPSYEGEQWRVELKLDTEVKAGAALTIEPSGTLTLIPPSGEVKGENALIFTAGTESGPPFTILGQAESSRIEAQRFIARIGAGLHWNGSKAEGDFFAEAELKGGKVVVDLSEGDGFLSTLLSGVGMESDFELGLGFSTAKGLYFHGSATLEVQLPLHVSLGPVELSALTLGVGIDGASLPISTALDIKAALGPLQAVVEQIGITANLSVAADGKGALGPLDIDIAFKPPKGVGLSIDAGVVKGGGYLFIDVARGEYAGALELKILDFLSVTATGIITTKMPDGSEGFSFLAIIAIEFNPGIQLGFGFTLIGVGGLVGLNRSMNLDALAQGARTGALDSVLFPTDVVANAPRIISDLRTFFPAEPDVFLIGPMAKLGWGTPTLISLSLGIIIEIPGDIAIVGKLVIAIPDEEAALIVIKVAFMGAIEIDKKRGWFFATLYESRIVFMPLDGSMGVLAQFGDDANFVVSVGGFHPSYNPPSLPFPALSRIGINILNTPVARIRVEAYFAVTSNTVQFGARAELYFGISIANIEGHLAFDALFQFSPFYFIITISASLSVKLFGAGLFSIRFRGSLEGTSPWHVEGTGSISLLFWDVDVDFSHTWGESENTKLPPVSVMPILAAEFEKDENWTAHLANANQLLVSLRTAAAGADLVLHPVGTLRITQRAVPLGIPLDKLGSQRPDDANLFTIAAATDGMGRRGEIRESFAIAQFQDLDDSERLSAADYEKEEAGLELEVTGNQVETSFVARRIARYEQIIIDTNFMRVLAQFAALLANLFSHFLANNSVARAGLSARSRDLKHLFDDKIVIHPNAYVVVNQADNSPLAGAPAAFASQASAKAFMAAQSAANPNFANEAHIVRPHEMKLAA